jgi:hypothetical protein|eukprot:COSAG06_NODE_16724_length_984_cov_3.371751_2_plen_70_part_00
MKELEKDHADMLAAYETGDKEMMEEADQMNNRVIMLAATKCLPSRLEHDGCGLASDASTLCCAAGNADM